MRLPKKIDAPILCRLMQKHTNTFYKLRNMGFIDAESWDGGRYFIRLDFWNSSFHSYMRRFSHG